MRAAELSLIFQPVSSEKKLADEINSRIAQGHHSRKLLAEELGIAYDTLRKDLSANRFFERDLMPLCAKLYLPTTVRALRRKYTFELKAAVRGLRKVEDEHSVKDRSLIDVFSELDARMERVRRFAKTVGRIIPDFFAGLRRNDLLAIYISDEMPTHWDAGGDNLQLLAAALKSGARITYLYPSDKLVEQIAKSAYSGLFTRQQVEQEFERFKRSLLTATDDEEVVENLCLVEHDCPFVCTPLHRFVIYFFGGKDVRSTGTLPIRHKDLRERSSENPVMELNDTFTEILKKAYVQSMQQAVEKEESSEGKKALGRFLNAALFLNGHAAPQHQRSKK